jgi:hypothetical protein
MYSLDSSETKLHTAYNKQSLLGLVPNRMLALLELSAASLNIAAVQAVSDSQMDLHDSLVVAFDVASRETPEPPASIV